MKTISFRPGKRLKELQGLGESESSVSTTTVVAVIVGLVLGFAAGYSWGVPNR